MPWRGADAAHHAGPEVAHEVAVEVAHHHHVELLRPRHHLHTAIVHNEVADLQLRKLLGDGAKRLEEEAVGELEDVGFVDAGHGLTAGRPRPLEGEAEEGYTPLPSLL